MKSKQERIDEEGHQVSKQRGRSLILIMKLEDEVDVEDVIVELNAGVLCRLEEDDKMIIGWRWLYPDADESKSFRRVH